MPVCQVGVLQDGAQTEVRLIREDLRLQQHPHPNVVQYFALPEALPRPPRPVSSPSSSHRAWTTSNTP